MAELRPIMELLGEVRPTLSHLENVVPEMVPITRRRLADKLAGAVASTYDASGIRAINQHKSELLQGLAGLKTLIPRSYAEMKAEADMLLERGIPGGMWDDNVRAHGSIYDLTAEQKLMLANRGRDLLRGREVNPVPHVAGRIPDPHGLRLIPNKPLVRGGQEKGVPEIWTTDDLPLALEYSQSREPWRIHDELGDLGLRQEANPITGQVNLSRIEDEFGDPLGTGYVHFQRAIPKNKMIYEAEGKDWTEVPRHEINREAMRKGHDAVEYRDMSDHYADMSDWEQPPTANNITVAFTPKALIPASPLRSVIYGMKQRGFVLPAAAVAAGASVLPGFEEFGTNTTPSVRRVPVRAKRGK